MTPTRDSAPVQKSHGGIHNSINHFFFFQTPGILPCFFFFSPHPRITSRRPSCGGSCRRRRPSIASPAWRRTRAPTESPEPWTTNPSPPPSTGRAISDQIPQDPPQDPPGSHPFLLFSPPRPRLLLCNS